MTIRTAGPCFGLVAALVLQGCGSGACADGTCDEGASQDFTLQYCQTGAECAAGNACLPMADADGAARGICLPPPPAGDGTTGDGTDGQPGQPGEGGGTAACFAETWGDPATCQPGVDWALRAVDSCRARGATLVDLHVLLSCDGLPGGAVFTCCQFGDLPVDPPPPPPPTGACVEMPIPGDPNTDPKEMAWRICADQNLVLADLKPLDMDAAGQVSTWLAVCCGGDVPVEPPPPPPEACQPIEFEVDCMSPWDWKGAVYERCAAAGGEIRDLALVGCEADGLGRVRAACCTGAVEPPPPEPPVPGTCVEVAVTTFTGDPALDPKMLAWQQCVDLGLELVDLQVRYEDPATGVATWLGTCCGDAPTPPEPPPEPPADPACPGAVLLGIGDGTCVAAFDWKGEADLQCRIIGGWLHDVQVRYSCGDGSVGAVIATCCVNPDPNAP